MSIIQLAWRNIIKNPLNLLMSIILFGLGVGLISFLLLFNTQLKDKFDKNLADIDLVVGAKGSPLQMILCNMYHIDNPTGNISIKNATPLLKNTHPLIKKAIPLSLGDNYKSYRIVGTNHEILQIYGAVLKEGTLWSKDFEVTIGQTVADETGLKIGDKFSSAHGFNDDADLAHDHSAFIVTGILGGTGSVIDQLILTNTASIWLVHEHEESEPEKEDQTSDSPEAHDHHHDATAEHNHDNSNEDLINHPEQEITSVLVQYKNRTNFQALNFGRNINENTEMQAASPAIEINRLYSMIGVGTDALQSLAILIALVSALSIFISLFKSMRERRYELALIRVLGAGRTKVFALIILEGLILALIGFLIGTALSHIGMELIANYLKKDFRYSFTGWKFLNVEWVVLGVSLFLGLVAAIIPAIQAARTDINKTLSEK
ncbi:MAG: ABC transporter permease [Saprospiraceae bacterium]|nr:ABC transporter permease [Saprospiraceae bacterium]MBK8670313.1 ABC transporter permease [Saprospiraceae bacterium]MBL0099143.1 ABC transporter permease [Saprospiraceae bacterium]